MRKFFKNRLATIGLIYVSIVGIAAILGYFITPDKTPYANQQFIELNALPPGSKVLFLSVPQKNEKGTHMTWYKVLLYGQQSSYQLIPIKSYQVIDTMLKVEPIGMVYPEYRGLIAPSLLGIHQVRDSANFAHTVAKLYIVEKKFWLGTDRMGRDVLSRLIIGARVSLSVGIAAVIISLLIGISLGAIAGYFRGTIDKIVMWLINVTWSIPTLLLVLSLTLVIKKGLFQVFVAIGLTMWVDVARMVRGQILSLREKEFVEACRAMGFGHIRILFRHILPFTIAPLIIVSTSNFASAILIESGLSFLGLGVQPPVPSWGSMIKEHYGYLLLGKAYLPLVPGLAIALLTLSFIYIGNGLRDALDIKNSVTNSVSS
ncbi:MAG: ABC transporter permease [Bacteroidales bacterium]|nr:ABC transporter permease [Bacteroidales bacterium]